jgi:hypothetical protein
VPYHSKQKRLRQRSALLDHDSYNELRTYAVRGLLWCAACRDARDGLEDAQDWNALEDDYMKGDGQNDARGDLVGGSILWVRVDPEGARVASCSPELKGPQWRYCLYAERDAAAQHQGTNGMPLRKLEGGRPRRDLYVTVI